MLHTGGPKIKDSAFDPHVLPGWAQLQTHCPLGTESHGAGHVNEHNLCPSVSTAGPLLGWSKEPEPGRMLFLGQLLQRKVPTPPTPTYCCVTLPPKKDPKVFPVKITTAPKIWNTFLIENFNFEITIVTCSYKERYREICVPFIWFPQT